MSDFSLPDWTARVLAKIGTRATLVSGSEHRKRCRRLADLGLIEILSTGRTSTVAVLTDAGSEMLTAPV